MVTTIEGRASCDGAHVEGSLVVSSPTDRPAPSAPGTHAIHVLLVDDEPLIIKCVGRLLAAAGFKVASAPDGNHAVTLLGSPSFDVIVSDIKMPPLDGLSLLRSIRGRDLDVPVIFMTGSPDLETVVEAMEFGAFGYLTKPVDGGELISAIQRAALAHRLALVRREATNEVSSKALGDRASLGSRFAMGLAKVWVAMEPGLS